MPTHLADPTRVQQLFLVLLLGMASVTVTRTAGAQRYKWQDDGFAYRRVVEIPSGMELPRVIVGEFFTHGALRGNAGQPVVYANRDVVPSYVLQIGPGDFCRVAFQTVASQPRYSLYYGGQRTDTTERPKWTARVGLMFETRRWKPCDLTRFESVRDAFQSSTRIGSDFVPQVFHRHNPFDIAQRPFLSRYIGHLNLPLTGKCAFYTSSQDCSFLLIDGKLVVQAPGTHGPETRAKIKGEIELAEGPHRFEYYHAASGAETCMTAAWQLPGFAKPSPISETIFGHDQIAHLPPLQLEHRDNGYLPDFRIVVLGDIPSPEGDAAMVRVQLGNVAAEAINLNAKYRWKFGDGQVSDQENPGHVFLHPGGYRIALVIQRGQKQLEIQNQVFVTRQYIVDAEEQGDEDLAAYLELLQRYNAVSLDPAGLVQMVRAYLLAEQHALAVDAGKMAFTSAAKSHTDETRWALVRLLGPVLLEKLDDPQTAAQLWVAASQRIERREWRFGCAIEAADILLNELLEPDQAKTLLDAAAARFADAASPARSKYYRVLADFYARGGTGEEARDAYSKADAVRDLSYTAIEKNAWRGAHSRSSEAFLQSEDWQQARHELEKWQFDFPGDKSDGYWSFLKMRYWMGREKYPQAIAVAGDLLAVNPNSPYADRLIFLTAKCEEQLGRYNRAAAAYQSLATDYPGSPLVETSRKQIIGLQEAQRRAAEDPAAASKTGGKKRPAATSKPGREKQ